MKIINIESVELRLVCCLGMHRNILPYLQSHFLAVGDITTKFAEHAREMKKTVQARQLTLSMNRNETLLCVRRTPSPSSTHGPSREESGNNGSDMITLKTTCAVYEEKHFPLRNVLE